MVDFVTPLVLAASKKAAEKSTEALLSKISLKFAKKKFDEISFALKKGLPAYVEAQYIKCLSIKTLLNRNDPIPLDECYVAPQFQLGGERSEARDLLKVASRDERKLVITGLAGSGKSIFLKFSFREVIEGGHTYYPIFFELRSLNRVDAHSGFFLNEIFESIRLYCPEFTEAQFSYALKTGAFYFLLDGFDELNNNIRDQVSLEINNVSTKFSRCPMLVTSRPSDDFVSWEGFSVATLLPFDLDGAVAYIRKLRFDHDRKEDFIADLMSGLFEKNKEFLSNPLLSAMMLLTYESFGEIPEKRHIFYAKCFDVLAREHDASKGRYKRKLFSDLTVEQLERAFMFFCASSYADRVISFSDEQMKSYVKDALEAVSLDCDVPDVIRDFRESLSIMERVGLFYEFAHRSFQEYFYAKFVVSDRKLKLKEKIIWLIADFSADDTVEMIADMDRTYFEDEFLLAEIKSLNTRLQRVDSFVNPYAILKICYNRVHASDRFEKSGNEVVREVFYTISDSVKHFLVRQALWRYRDCYKERLEVVVSDKSLTTQEVAEILDSKFNGEVVFSRSCNPALIEIGACVFAERIKVAIQALCEELTARNDRRKKGVGSLIRRTYGRRQK